MPKKKTADEIPPESQELPAEQTEGTETPSEETSEPIEAETAAEADPDAVLGEKPKRSRSKAKQPEDMSGTEPLPDGEPYAVGLPVEDGYPAGEIPDIVSVEFETSGEDQDVPPEPDVPYGEGRSVFNRSRRKRCPGTRARLHPRTGRHVRTCRYDGSRRGAGAAARSAARTRTGTGTGGASGACLRRAAAGGAGE